jgi:hypothetical protein
VRIRICAGQLVPPAGFEPAVKAAQIRWLTESGSGSIQALMLADESRRRFFGQLAVTMRSQQTLD